MDALCTDPWTAAMRRGDFAAAWRVSDAVLARRVAERVDCFAWPRHLQFLWDGRAPDHRRVLVHCYHGLGDTLQFVRLLPRLRERAREVVLWAQPALLGLLDGVAGADRVLPLHDGAPDVERDLDLELMELPHLLRLELADVPREAPYLRVARACRRRDAAAVPRVGLAWRAGDWDASRSVPDAALAPLAALRGVRWVSLQYPPATPPLPAVDAACRDLAELARRMLELDLVISVDTMTAHLAGALGVPVWTLLAEPCDWRWMERRADSPWYPTMRLLRQPRPGDWDGLVAQLADALAAWLAEYAHAVPGARPERVAR
ncbi:MAG TPA: hypothetical protein VGC30_10645 [Dokdonella sp.]